VVFSLSKGTGTVLFRYNEKGGERAGNVLSAILSVPLIRKIILLQLPYVTPSLENRGMTGSYVFFPTKCHCPTAKYVRKYC